MEALLGKETALAAISTKLIQILVKCLEVRYQTSFGLHLLPPLLRIASRWIRARYCRKIFPYIALLVNRASQTKQCFSSFHA